MGKQKYYVVWEGTKTGIFKSWKECETSVKGYVGAKFKSFNNVEFAKLAYEIGPTANIWDKITERQYQALGKKINLPVLNSLSVDAACSGNPGVMEYRGVYTRTSTLIFAQGPFEEATVNLGEFLAIVHGLAQLGKSREHMPIYTDSRTAMKWINDKKVNTKLERSANNKKVFGYVDRALVWLKSHTYTNQIFKWDTENWGEIPADFGRK